MAKILIIDDDTHVRSILCLFVSNAGYEVQDAEDGVDGMRLYKGESFDLVITDLIMPHKDGLETILELQQLDPDVKVIALSGGGRVSPESYLKLAKAQGAVAVFEKPIDQHVLLAAIEDVLAN